MTSYVAPMRGAQLPSHLKSSSVPDELLLLVADARADRQAVADAPGVLHEEARVLLRRRAPGVQVRAGHPVDLPDVRVGEDLDAGAGAVAWPSDSVNVGPVYWLMLLYSMSS